MASSLSPKRQRTEVEVETVEAGTGAECEFEIKHPSRAERRKENKQSMVDELPASVQILLGPSGPERDEFIASLDKELEDLPLQRKRILGISKHENQIPYRGIKEGLLDGSRRQDMRIESARIKLFESMSAARGSRGRALISGEWVDNYESSTKGRYNESVVVITKPRGKLLSSLGIQDSSKLLLSVEEAVFLADRGSLEIFYGGRRLSIQESFAKMLSTGFPLDLYVCYALLKRMGYAVRRVHEPLMNELDIEIDAATQVKAVIGIKSEVSVGKEKKRGRGDEGEGEVEEGQKSSLWSRFTHSISGLWKTIASTDADADAKPVLPTLDIPAADAYTKLRIFEQTSLYDRLEASTASTAAGAGDAVVAMDIDGAGGGEPSKYRSKSRYVKCGADETPIHYDIYQPGTRFKKTDPHEPMFRLCVVDYLDPIPSLSLIRQHTLESFPTPVKYAVCDGGVVTFFGFQTANLKVVVSGGDAQELEPAHLMQVEQGKEKKEEEEEKEKKRSRVE